MITEDYVSFEIAKLLEEKGFNGDTASCYILEDSTHHIMSDKVVQSEYYESQDSNEYGHLIQAPTLQMVMKWLRKVYNIIIIIDTNDIYNENRFYFCRIYWARGNRTEIKWKISNIDKKYEYFTTYEQACEAAINYCLKNLI